MQNSQDILILIGRDTYINSLLISKDFIMALCIITNIKHQAIMMRYMISLQNKSCSIYAKLAGYPNINWER
jgi:hypothetical protein